MTRKDALAWYGRIGLIVAAFALVGGVVAAPLLLQLWTPLRMMAQR